MICQACKRSMHPVWEILPPAPGRPGGLVPKCPFDECRAAVPQSVIDGERIAAERKAAAELAAESGAPVAAASANGGDIVVPQAAPTDGAMLLVQNPAISPAATPTGAEPLDVLALATARLAFLKARIAELRGLEREAERLEALLAAAKPRRRTPRAKRRTPITRIAS